MQTSCYSLCSSVDIVTSRKGTLKEHMIFFPMFCSFNYLLFRPSKEARERLSKDAKKCADEAKTCVRRVRQSAISTLRKQKDSVSKDSINKLENSVSLKRKHNGNII